jgi:hypothetical protein
MNLTMSSLYQDHYLNIQDLMATVEELHLLLRKKLNLKSQYLNLVPLRRDKYLPQNFAGIMTEVTFQ